MKSMPKLKPLVPMETTPATMTMPEIRYQVRRRPTKSKRGLAPVETDEGVRSFLGDNGGGRGVVGDGHDGPPDSMASPRAIPIMRAPVTLALRPSMMTRGRVKK